MAPPVLPTNPTDAALVRRAFDVDPIWYDALTDGTIPRPPRSARWTKPLELGRLRLSAREGWRPVVQEVQPGLWVVTLAPAESVLRAATPAAPTEPAVGFLGLLTLIVSGVATIASGISKAVSTAKANKAVKEAAAANPAPPRRDRDRDPEPDTPAPAMELVPAARDVLIDANTITLAPGVAPPLRHTEPVDVPRAERAPRQPRGSAPGPSTADAVVDVVDDALGIATGLLDAFGGLGRGSSGGFDEDTYESGNKVGGACCTACARGHQCQG